MNKEYIKELYEENKDIFKDCELDIENSEDLKEYMESIIISNMEYDLHIYLDIDKLFNQNNKELTNEDFEIEKEN